MRHVPGDEVPDGETPGEFAWRTQGPAAHTPGGRFLMYTCPRGRVCGVPIRPHVLPNGAGWAWDGDEDAPTLAPSINCVGGCGWHGFVVAGRMTNG